MYFTLFFFPSQGGAQIRPGGAAGSSPRSRKAPPPGRGRGGEEAMKHTILYAYFALMLAVGLPFLANLGGDGAAAGVIL